MIYDILAKKLTAAGLVEGENLFVGFMPAQITEGVMLRQPLGGIKIDYYIPGFYRGTIQAVVRSVSVQGGEPLAMRVQKLLTVAARENYPATDRRGEAHLDLCVPQTLPVQYPRLDGNAIEWSQQFDVAFGMKGLI